MKTALRAARDASETVTVAADRTRAGLLELGVQTIKLLSRWRSSEPSGGFASMLERIGLQRRESALRPVALFLAGAAVAGSAALLLAPTSGKKLRAKIRSIWLSSLEATATRLNTSDVSAASDGERSRPSASSDGLKNTSRLGPVLDGRSEAK